MLELYLKELLPFFPLAMGALCILAAVFKKSPTAYLKRSGQRTEGIIYAVGATAPGMDTSYVMDKITVRFVTREGRWITGDIKQEFASFYTNQYKLGEKVEVYYDPQHPASFFVKTKQSEERMRMLLVAIGLIFCAVGVIMLVAS